MAASARATARAARIAAAALVGIVAACAAAYLLMGRAAEEVRPSPTSVEPSYSDGWPEVDWDYWLSVNPSIVGWLSVDGTDVSQPIVQASPDAPQWWLRHDVWGNWSLYGCVYLDADCAAGGLTGSQNAAIFGHNMGFGDMSMLAQFASYSSPEFAAAHRTVRIQTPAGRRLLEVRAAAVIGGWQATKRTHFEGEADFDGWWSDRVSEACVVLDGSPSGVWETGAVTIATCSYNYWSNERTVTYLADADIDGKNTEGSEAHGTGDRG